MQLGLIHLAQGKRFDGKRRQRGHGGADGVEAIALARHRWNQFADIGKWLASESAVRPHSAHGILTADEVNASKTEPVRMAA